MKNIVFIIVALLGFIIGFGLYCGIKKQLEIENKVLAIGLKKYPQCANAYSQFNCIKGLHLAEMEQQND